VNGQKQVARAREEIGAIINKEKEKLRKEKMDTLKEIKAEVADLVIASLEKVLEKKFSGNDNKEFIRKIVKNR